MLPDHPPSDSDTWLRHVARARPRAARPSADVPAAERGRASPAVARRLCHGDRRWL